MASLIGPLTFVNLNLRLCGSDTMGLFRLIQGFDHMKWMLLATTAAVYAVQVVAPDEALASGFMIRENSAESIATVYAGNASRADDVSTVFNNPAGMSWLQGSQLEVGSAAVFPSINFHGNATVMGAPIPGDNTRNGGPSALLPH